MSEKKKMEEVHSVSDVIRETFWKPQAEAMRRFEEVTNNSRYETNQDDLRVMRVNMCCGSGKSRLMNAITLRFNRSCVLFPSLALIYQYLNGEIFGGVLNPEPGKTIQPEWIDHDRKILVICSQGYQRDLTDQQIQLLEGANNELQFDLLLDENRIFQWLHNILLKNKKCVVLCTYHSAWKLRNVIDRLSQQKHCVFGITCYDEAHCICTTKRSYLYRTTDDDNDNDNDDDDDDDDDDNNDDDDVDLTTTWKNLSIMGHRYFATATYSELMIKNIQFFGEELINYSHANGVDDGVIRDFDVHINICRANQKKDDNAADTTLANAIRISAVAMKNCDRRRALFFHRFSNVCSSELKGTSAITASTDNYYDLFVKYLGVSRDKVWVQAVTGATDAASRSKLFNEFQQPPTDGIYRVLGMYMRKILLFFFLTWTQVTCRVVGVGVDLRCIDMVTFVDPRHTFVTVTQNISRGVRKNQYDDRPCVIVIPVVVDESQVVNSTASSRNVALQTLLKKTCFERLAKFVYALKEMDPRWREILLNDAKNTMIESNGGGAAGDNNAGCSDNRNSSNRSRLHIFIDSELETMWDVSPEDIIDETKNTLRLMCESEDETSAIIDARIEFMIQHYPDAFPKKNDRTRFPDGMSTCKKWIENCKSSKAALELKNVKPCHSRGIAIEKLAVSKYQPWITWLSSGEHVIANRNHRIESFITFLKASYPKKLPGQSDKCVFPDSDLCCGTWIHYAQRQKNEKMREKIRNRVKPNYVYLDESDYQPWHHWVKNFEAKTTTRKSDGLDMTTAVAKNRVEFLRKNFPNMTIPVKKSKLRFPDNGAQCRTWLMTIKKAKKNQVNGERIPQDAEQAAINALDLSGWKSWLDWVAEMSKDKKTNTKEREYDDDSEEKEEDLEEVNHNKRQRNDGEEIENQHNIDDLGRLEQDELIHQNKMVEELIDDNKRQRNDNLCDHIWTFEGEEGNNCHYICEICARHTTRNRTMKRTGYKSSNLQKKQDINEWLSKQKYIRGKAVILDASGMQTTNALVKSGLFDVKDIIIPEHNDKVFEQNVQHTDYGQCMRRGDFLDNLKILMMGGAYISLIYADFTGRYEKFVKPLFQYLSEQHLQKGTIVGVTWSNNGAGTLTERSKIERKIGVFMEKNGYVEVDNPAVSESGYGHASSMNVQFMIKQ